MTASSSEGARRPRSRHLTDQSSLPAALRLAATANPDSVALAVDGGEQLTYAAWETRSDAVAAGLERAVGRSDRVALLFDGARWTDYAVAHLAVNKAGAVAVPLLAGLSKIELGRILHHCEPAAVIASPSLAPQPGGVPILDPDELEAQGAALPPPAARPAAVVETLYRPRPLGPVAPEPFGRANEEHVPLLHAFPPGAQAAPGALRGCLAGTRTSSVVLPEFDAVRMCALIEAEPERACGLHPATAHAVLESGAAAHHDVSRLTQLMLASGDLSARLLMRLAETFPLARLLLVDVPGVHAVLLYHRSHPVALGRPSDPSGVWVAGERGQTLAPGELGRVCGGPLRGYVDDDGFVYSSPGRDAVVRLGDRTVLKAEVERSLREHPAVRDAALLAGRGPDPALAAIRETVIAVWSRILRREDIPPEADFFELGGDNAAVASVLRLLEDAFAVPMAPSTLIEAPTVAKLSCEIARLHAQAGSPAGGDPVAPAAFSQEGMLWHELFAPGCQNLPGLARRYRGPLDLAALTAALDEIVRRHDALRTRFELRRGRLVQVVRPHERLDPEVRDLSALPAGERDKALARLVAEAGQRPFDLALDSLFVPTLLRLGEEDHVLVIRTHHSVFDDWSVGVFRRQLAKLYNAYAAGKASPLPQPALQFADFSRRQRADLAGRAGTRELAFWRRELAGAPLATQLAVDDPNAPAGTPQPGGEAVPLTLGPDLHARLKALARQERATLFMATLAAFGVLVHRYTGSEDLVMATVVANRNRTELEGLIGCFTKKVPVRLRLDGDPPFTKVLERARESLLGALSHQDLPFEAVVQDVLGPAAAAHGLVPHVALMFQGVTPSQELVLDGVDSAGLETAAQAGRAHFMAGAERSEAELPPPPWGGGLYAGTFVILSIDESGGELSCTARGAFHAPAVRGLLERFGTLLASIVADPERPISELGLLDRSAAAEARNLGRGALASPPVDALPGALRAQVSRAPEAVAVRTRLEALTFAQLDERSEALAGRLRAGGAGRGSRVGTALEASLDLIVAVLGIWKAGAAWVGLDPADCVARRARIVREAAVEMLIGEAGLAALDAAPTDDPCDEAAVVFYGSGSSATEDGAVLDHRAVLNLLTALRDAVASAPHVSLCPGPTDDAFLRRLVALLDGDPLYIADRPLRADPGEILGLLARGDIDLIDTTPEELRALLGAGLDGGLPEGIDAVVVIGTRAPVSPELLRAVRGARGVRPHVLYGPPECGFGATAAAWPLRGVGRSLANVSVSVLDARGRIVPIGAVGELHLRGSSLAHGFCGGSERTSGRFTTVAGERLYASGLRARLLSDGTVELLGVLGGSLELRGFHVDPARIEAALAGYPGLGAVEVALERDGAGEPRLVASVAADGTAPTLAQLHAYLWDKLPGYALPTRLVLRGAGAAQVDEASGIPGAATELAQESVLSALWAAELGVDRVGSDANYWQVFSFIDALARARETGVRVRGEDVSRSRTLGTLATATSSAAGRGE